MISSRSSLFISLAMSLPALSSFPILCSWDPPLSIDAGDSLSAHIDNPWGSRCQAKLEFSNIDFFPIIFRFDPLNCTGIQSSQFTVPSSSPNGSAHVLWQCAGQHSQSCIHVNISNGSGTLDQSDGVGMSECVLNSHRTTTTLVTRTIPSSAIVETIQTVVTVPITSLSPSSGPSLSASSAQASPSTTSFAEPPGSVEGNEATGTPSAMFTNRSTSTAKAATGTSLLSSSAVIETAIPNLGLTDITFPNTLTSTTPSSSAGRAMDQGSASSVVTAHDSSTDTTASWSSTDDVSSLIVQPVSPTPPIFDGAPASASSTSPINSPSPNVLASTSNQPTIQPTSTLVSNTNTSANVTKMSTSNLTSTPISTLGTGGLESASQPAVDGTSENASTTSTSIPAVIITAATTLTLVTTLGVAPCSESASA